MGRRRHALSWNEERDAVRAAAKADKDPSARSEYRQNAATRLEEASLISEDREEPMSPPLEGRR